MRSIVKAIFDLIIIVLLRQKIKSKIEIVLYGENDRDYLFS